MIKSDHGRLDVIMVSSTTSGQTARQTDSRPAYFSKSREKNFFSIVELHDKCIHVLFQCESSSLDSPMNI